MEKVAALSSFDKFLLKYSKTIDNIDMYLGPFADISRENKIPVLEDLSYVANAVEFGLLKIPFAVMYLARTKDFHALLNWVPRELFAVSVPYGSFIEILRNYEKTAFEFYGVDRKAEF